VELRRGSGALKVSEGVVRIGRGAGRRRHGTGRVGRVGKRAVVWGFRNHYGWWWIGAYTSRN
jgi:hypothetical protein